MNHIFYLIEIRNAIFLENYIVRQSTWPFSSIILMIIFSSVQEASDPMRNCDGNDGENFRFVVEEFDGLTIIIK